MNNEEFEKLKKKISELGDVELGIMFSIVHTEMCKREAKKMVLRLIDEQK